MMIMTIKPMKILLLNDNEDSVSSFKEELKLRSHCLYVARTPEECLKLYQSELQEVFLKTDPVEHIQPFDAVILDCESCQVRGLEIAKEILAVNSRQRIVLILKSEAYQSISGGCAEEIKTSLAILQKPVATRSILDMVELKEVYAELEKMHVDTDVIRRANFRHEQILKILNTVTNSKAAHLG